MRDARYDVIGAGYAVTRREDPRIAAPGTRHDRLRQLDEYDAGLRLLVSDPA